MPKPKSLELFSEEDTLLWKEEWQDMPEFSQEDVKPYDSINVQFRTPEDKVAFLTLLGESPTRRKSIWYPQVKYFQQSNRDAPRVIVDPNKYPVYVISKGRWEDRLTVNVLEKLGIPYHIVIEPQEYNQYSSLIDPEKIYVLPFSNLGQGSIPARNWVWEHSISIGAEKALDTG